MSASRSRQLAATALGAALLVASAAGPARAADDGPGTDRWWGADRCGTAAAIADSAFPDPPVDVVVNGTSCADALASAPLAASLDAPVLTVTA